MACRAPIQPESVIRAIIQGIAAQPVRPLLGGAIGEDVKLLHRLAGNVNDCHLRAHSVGRGGGGGATARQIRFRCRDCIRGGPAGRDDNGGLITKIGLPAFLRAGIVEHNPHIDDAFATICHFRILARRDGAAQHVVAPVAGAFWGQEHLLDGAWRTIEDGDLAFRPIHRHRGLGAIENHLPIAANILIPPFFHLAVGIHSLQIEPAVPPLAEPNLKTAPGGQRLAGDAVRSPIVFLRGGNIQGGDGNRSTVDNIGRPVLLRGRLLRRGGGRTGRRGSRPLRTLLREHGR